MYDDCAPCVPGGGMYGNTVIRIQKLQNGFSVGLNDPEIIKANRARDRSKGECAPYRDPEVTYAFANAAEVAAFITANLDKVMPEDEFSSSFDKAAKEAAASDD